MIPIDIFSRGLIGFIFGFLILSWAYDTGNLDELFIFLGLFIFLHLIFKYLVPYFKELFKVSKRKKYPEMDGRFPLPWE